MIGIYDRLTPQELEDILMSSVRVGDADELHNAVIVLCKIVKRQADEIDELKSKAAQTQIDAK